MLLEQEVVCTASDLSTVSMKHCQVRARTFQAALKWFERRQKEKVFWTDDAMFEYHKFSFEQPDLVKDVPAHGRRLD